MSDLPGGQQPSPGADGWYQDPLTERWWDGAVWTEAARAAGQSVPDGPIGDPSAAVPAGWYPDPRVQRRWDGTSWTVETRPVPTDTVTGRGSGHRRLLLLIGVIAALVLVAGAVVFVVGGGQSNSADGVVVAERVDTADDTGDAAVDGGGSASTAKTTIAAPTTAPVNVSSTVPPTTVPPTVSPTSVPPVADHPYFRALGRWDEGGAVDMLGSSQNGSPAWSYARNLQQGFRAGASATGIASVRALSSDSVEHCIGERCFVLSDVELVGDDVVSFSVDGADLEGRVGGWALDDVWTCWYFGADQGCPAPNAATIHLTSIYRVGTTTYVSVEVQVGESTPGPVVFESMSITDSTGSHIDTDVVAEPVAVGGTAVWLIVTDGVDVGSVWEVSIGATFGSDYRVWLLSPDTSTSTEPPTESSAQRYLDDLIASDRSVLDRVSGRYLPQLSAKQYDWSEPTTGRYYDWRGILDDHLQYRSRPHGAILMAPYEYTDAASPWFRTLVPVPFLTEDEVRDWCEANGYQWGVTCISRRVD